MTSSQKKRRISRRAIQAHESGDSSSPETPLPSCEQEDDPSYSFTTSSVASGRDTPSYIRSDSVPASGLPPRLQTQLGANTYANYAASADSSSPVGSTYAEAGIDTERRRDEAGSLRDSRRSQSPFLYSRRAIMSADLPHRSSSPLKRRASSMEADQDIANEGPDAHAGPRSTEGEDTRHVNELRTAMSVDPPSTETAAASDAEDSPPPLTDQVKTIETLLKAFADTPSKDGDKAYIVSRSWVDKALSVLSDSKSKTNVETTELGPVDNSDIIVEVIKQPDATLFTRLTPGSGLESFELFSEDAWNLVVKWYGTKEDQQPIIRTAINTAFDAMSEPNIMYEYHPPIFQVHRLWSEVSTLPIEQALKADNPPPLRFARSCKSHAQTFVKDMKTLSGIPMDRKIRMWRIATPIPAGNDKTQLDPADPVSGQDGWSNLLLDVLTFSQVRDTKEKLDLQDQTTNSNYNGGSTLQLSNLVTDQIIVLDEQIDNRWWVSTYNGKDKIQDKSIPTRPSMQVASSRPSSGRSSPAPHGMTTRGKGKKRFGRNHGVVGLSNLGNTCYMNSALQCVRSVEELTKYFLTDSFDDEINSTNPLGYSGRVAIAYGSLLKEIYNESRGSVTPREFKTTVGRCRTTFSGWGQQDSQEFLGFLLDALQEDLSRVKKKPYIEKPDSTDEMVNDQEAIRKMAEDVWDITRRRDDSVIADLFTGMYKSTLKCPECDKISITFDPFNNLTLPLPVQDVWTRTVLFYPLNDTPVKVEVELPKHSSMEVLKQFLSDRVGVPVNLLMGAEEYKARFFRIYENDKDVSEQISSSDTATFHELEAVPTNFPAKGQKQKYRSMLDTDTPMDADDWAESKYDCIVVPVFHRRTSGRVDNDSLGPPHFICLTREEAKDYGAIERKVLERVSTISSWPGLLECYDKGDASAPDSDTATASASEGDVIATSASEGDSSGESKIGAQSVDGESDMVDVTMKDAGGRPSPEKGQSKILRHFNKKRPNYINRETYLAGDLQNLFDLCYFVQKDEPVPTGWTVVDNKTLPKIADRMPEATDEGNEGDSPESWNGINSDEEKGSSNDDEGDDTARAATSQTRMADESDEGDDIPAVRRAHELHHPLRKVGPGGRKKFKGNRTYGKKANKRQERAMRKAEKQFERMQAVKPQPMPAAVPDGGPLIRIGEGLVVEWRDEAWARIFYDPESGPDHRRYKSLETLADPVLRAAQRRRTSRRSRGITLDECLDEFERAEVLSEQDMWYCPRCKEHRRASKKFDLWKTPDILVAHLKRFSSSGYRRDKLDVLVDFPIEGLDLTNRVIQKEDSKDEIYDLIAVDDHYGGLGGGHYTAYAKNFIDGRWWNYNDSSTGELSRPESAITSAAYLLFYRRRSSKPLGGDRFTRIAEKYAAEVGDDTATESGNEQESGGNTLSGLSARGRRGSPKTTVTVLDDSDDAQPPPYNGSGLRRSIENDGTDDNGTSLSMTQGWNFANLGGNNRNEGYASDEAQVDSDDDEQSTDQRSFAQDDTEMENVGASQQLEYTGGAGADAQGALPDVLNVPAATSEAGSDDYVAEIHVEAESGQREL